MAKLYIVSAAGSVIVRDYAKLNRYRMAWTRGYDAGFTDTELDADGVESERVVAAATETSIEYASAQGATGPGSIMEVGYYAGFIAARELLLA